MIVRCISNEGLADPRSDFIEVGSHHVVYGLSMLIPGAMKLTLGRSSPYTYPLSLFEVIDARLSRYWVFSETKWAVPGGEETLYLWGFREEAESNAYRLALVEGDSKAIQVFDYWKGLMDLEFPLPFVDRVAKLLDPGWVMCEHCTEAWEHKSQSPMLRCPNCGTLQHNPECSEERWFGVSQERHPVQQLRDSRMRPRET